MEKTKRNFFSILLYYKLVKTSVKSNDKEFFCRAGVMYQTEQKIDDDDQIYKSEKIRDQDIFYI